jgi:MFS family permease
MHKSRLVTVFLIILVDLIGFGVILPLLPFYASDFGASPVQVGLLYSVFSVAQLIFSPIWGSLSDRIGRRPVMLLSTAGAAVAYVVFGLAETLTVLFVARFIAGVMGGNISAAQAYIADSTTPENRARGMGLLGAAFGLGFVMGPAIATALIHPAFQQFFVTQGWDSTAAFIAEHRLSLPAYAAALLSSASFVLVWFKLEETVVPGAHAASGNQRSGFFTLQYWKDLPLDQPKVRWMFASFFLLSFAQASLYSSFPLFCEAVLGMTAEQVGVQFFYIGIIAVAVQGFLIKPLTKLFREETLFLVGNIMMVLGLFMIAFTTEVWHLTVYLVIMTFGNSLNAPTITSLLSKSADPSRVGTIMGAAQGLGGLGRTLGPTWGGALFGIAFGLPFAATAVVAALTIVAGVRVRKSLLTDIK